MPSEHATRRRLSARRRRWQSGRVSGPGIAAADPGADCQLAVAGAVFGVAGSHDTTAAALA